MNNTPYQDIREKIEQDSEHIRELLLKSVLGPEEVRQSQQRMIMSVSGWRKIFSTSGNEEDTSTHISPADMLLAGIIGLSFADFLIAHTGKKAPTACVACDTRPTGGIIAAAFMQALLYRGLNIRYLAVSATPETLALTALNDDIDAFAYISASHNPIAYNGFKFGLEQGTILTASPLRTLEKLFFKHIKESQSTVYSILSSKMDKNMLEIARLQKAHKLEALQLYRQFSEEIIDPREDLRSETLNTIRSFLKKNPIGILGELNGSARTLSIDKPFLENLAARVRLVNDTPGHIVHRIVPEGRSLNLCKTALEKAYAEDSSYILGYVPDNDGDRGNIVYIDNDGHAQILEAQTVFALVALSECAWLEYSGELGTGRKAAIAANGPTSMRVDEIAQAFGIECWRAEVGEAHVLALADTLRKEGYTVRLSGEGSNGGSIIYPSKVRDPLSSIASILKLLAIRDSTSAQKTSTHDTSTQKSTSHSPGLFHRYCTHIGKEYSPHFTIADVIATLPVYTTTSASEDISIMQITSSNYAQLKAAWEAIFLKEWDRRREELEKRWGIHSWLELNTESSEEKRGFGSAYRSGPEKGGLKILFSDSAGTPQAYIWMRSSGTEVAFRTIVDVRGDRPELEEHLIQWQRNMIERADQGG